MRHHKERVECSIVEDEVENEGGHYVPGVIATCEKCGHKVESFGTSERSIRRCLAVMSEECPEDEKNYYFTRY